MTRFQDLSNELVLGILENVLPDDVVSISLASKHVYRLAIPRLEEHRILGKQYTNFKNMVEHKPSNWHDPGGLLANLLCTIMSDARVGHYVKKIDLDMWSSHARDGWKPDAVFEKPYRTSSTRLQQNSKTNMEIIEEAVRAVDIIRSIEVDDWLYQIRRGNEDPLVALLLLHAPRLETLKFIVPYANSESSYLLKTIQRVTAQGSTTDSYPYHLKNVEIWFAEAWQSLEFVKSFMSLPLLTCIKTSSLFVDGRRHKTDSAVLPQNSNVTDMSFRSGYLPTEAIAGLLRGVKSLKSFTYEFRHLWRDEGFTLPFDCVAALETLETNAGHTLESLRLSAEEIEASQIAPLRDFRVLREIEMQTFRCFAVQGGKPADIILSLPISLERLAMSWYEGMSFKGIEEMTEAILELVRESKSQLPHLRKLHFSTRDQREADALWDCLDTDETAQINPILSFEIRGPSSEGGICAWADNVCTCGRDCFGGSSH